MKIKKTNRLETYNSQIDINNINIYAVIIGSEILNRKREDKHFNYLSTELAKVGHTLFSSFIIKDNAELIKQIYTLIKNDPKAFMFSFGGIGSTPDDLTRELSAEIFKDAQMQRNKKFEQDIIDRIGEKAYPHPIKMSDLPVDAELLHNPVNNMSGYYLNETYFFMPGFPDMAQPMIDCIIKEHLPSSVKIYTRSFIANIGEGILIELMNNVPNEIELSSLPFMNNGNPKVEFSLSCTDEAKVELHFKKFTDFLNTKEIVYHLL